MDTLRTLADALLPRLAWTSAQAVLLIAVLWLIMRYMPRLSAAVRCMLWWLVGAQLLLGMALNTPVQLHWLKPVAQMAFIAPHEVIVHANAETTAAMAAAQATALAAPANHGMWSWPEAALLLWLSIILLQAIFAVRHWLEARALVREARTPASAALSALCTQQARALGMRRIPALRISDAIVSPQVSGLWRPVVLLPSEQTLSQDELAMAIAHELAHIHRGDLWLGWIPALAQRLFFFHPLASWAMREYAIHREAACDAQVLQRHDATPQHYGHLLVRLGVVDPVHSSLAGASSTFLHLKRRLIMLQQSQAKPRKHGWLLVAAMALIGVLPYRVTTARAEQASTAAQTPSATGAYAIPPPPPAPAIPPLPPAPPSTTVPPPPLPPPAPDFNAAHVEIDTKAHADHGFVLLDGDTVIVQGSDADLARAQRLDHGNAPLLWLRQNNKSYLIRDTDVIRHAQDIYAQSAQVAQAQGELAGKQGELAGQQAGLAARHADLASRQADVENRRAALMQHAAQRATPQDGGDNEASLEGELRGLDRELADIQRENKAIDQQASALSRQEAELSKQEAAMSKQEQQHSQDRNRQLDRVLSDAIAKGLAKPVDR
jgi:bla regulator protein BlaR1